MLKNSSIKNKAFRLYKNEYGEKGEKQNSPSSACCCCNRALALEVVGEQKAMKTKWKRTQKRVKNGVQIDVKIIRFSPSFFLLPDEINH